MEVQVMIVSSIYGETNTVQYLIGDPCTSTVCVPRYMELIILTWISIYDDHDTDLIKPWIAIHRDDWIITCVQTPMCATVLLALRASYWHYYYFESLCVTDTNRQCHEIRW